MKIIIVTIVLMAAAWVGVTAGRMLDRHLAQTHSQQSSLVQP